MVKNFKVNWKTTLGGLVGVALFLAAEFEIPVAEVKDWGKAGGVIAIALGLTQSRDGDMSSEDQK